MDYLSSLLSVINERLYLFEVHTISTTKEIDGNKRNLKLRYASTFSKLMKNQRTYSVSLIGENVEYGMLYLVSKSEKQYQSQGVLFCTKADSIHRLLVTATMSLVR